MAIGVEQGLAPRASSWGVVRAGQIGRRLGWFAAIFALGFSSVASAETLRLTVDNVVEEVLVDGVPFTLGPNSGSWTIPDDYVLDLAPGRHVVAIRGRDEGSISGMMAVVYADDGVTPIAVTTPSSVRTVRVDPGAGWGALAFDDSAWPAAGACANPGPWGGSVTWGRNAGADMVWGPERCDGDEVNITRWFRFEVVVLCADASECPSDGNPCTAATCGAGTCGQAPLGSGALCPGGACDGAGTCVECVDDSTCDAPRSICDVGINTCVECLGAEDCNDGNACTTDTCALGVCGFPTAPAGTSCPGGVCLGSAPACVACLGAGDCGGATPVCETGTNTCVACLGAGDCGGSTPVCDTGTNTCVACLGDGDCSGTTSFCDTSARTCVECLDASTCDDGNPCTVGACDVGSCAHAPAASGASCLGGVCDGGGACVACVGDAQCPGARCDVTTNTCVACLGAGDCDDGDPCTVGTCEAGSCAQSPSAAGTPCADGVCAGTSATCVTCVGEAQCAAPTPWCVANDCVACRDADDCDDGNECTVDTCEAGACGGTPREAGAACGLGVCTPAAVCAPVAVAITSPPDGLRTAMTTLTLTGTATPGVEVTVRVDGVVVGTVVAAADGSWSLTLTTPLDDGERELGASVATAGGAASATISVTIDTTTEVTITAPEDGSTIDDWTPNVRGTGEPGATVVVTLDGEEVGTTTVEGDGTWLVAIDEPLADGTYTVEATATDVVGNVATASSSFDVAAGTEISITTPANGSVTSDDTPTITGTAAPGATVVVTIEVAGETVEVGTATADGEGLWSVEVSEALPEGRHTVTARATDDAGNTASDEAVFTVDRTTNVSIEEVDASGVVTGTGEPGATVVVTVDGVELGRATVAEDGTWRVEGDALEPGEREVVATITDAAGNTATDVTTVTVPAPADAGVADGGVDAGVTDAGISDASVPVDAITVDGGGEDAGTAGRHSGGGCSCRTSGNGRSPLVLVVLVGFALLRRRRR